ncbi:MAG TPA: hypothetical protein VMZ26_08090 [Pyrinomonadaceae bacterium]|nr:hypothetical protein [Pyrinomonadaceae bacterium]
MNEEYLWNKTGEDPEIEKMEKALAVFRYREATPAAVVPRYEASPHRPGGFRISFAFAFACLAVVMVFAVLWLRISNDNTGFEDAGEIVFVQQEAEIPSADPSVEPRLQPIRTPDSNDRPAGGRRRTVTRTSAAVRHRPRLKDVVPKDTIATLTEEERFAYRQLMLALSITGSKLKIVQDAIDGKESVEDDDSKNQR